MKIASAFFQWLYADSYCRNSKIGITLAFIAFVNLVIFLCSSIPVMAGISPVQDFRLIITITFYGMLFFAAVGLWFMAIRTQKTNIPYLY